jgi:translation initiation factor IF-3
LGIISAKEAQSIADESKMDLVKINPNAKPPVCKIMDYSKFKYDQAKKLKEARKKQKTAMLKEVRLSPNIGKHDLDVKIRQTVDFLKEGDKVKISVKFRGRELGHTEVAHGIFENFVAAAADMCDTEKPAKMEGRNMTITLAPKSNPAK